MSHYKARPLVVAIHLALALFTPIALAAPDPNPINLLFVEEAAGGTLTGPDDQHLTLTLKGLRDYVTSYSDRPIRAASLLPIQQFVDMWPNYFHNDPPNAVLSIKTSNIKDNRAIKQQGGVSPAIVPISLVLTLSNPHLAADQKSVTYDAKRIFKSTANATKLPYNKPTVLVLATPQKFGAAVLNIDNGNINCPYTTQYDNLYGTSKETCASPNGNACVKRTLFNVGHCDN
jgi:hypothetical protein